MRKLTIILIGLYFFSSCVPNYTALHQSQPHKPVFKDIDNVLIVATEMPTQKSSKRIVKMENKGILLQPVWVQNNTDEIVQFSTSNVNAFVDMDTVEILLFDDFYRKVKYPIWDKVTLGTLGIPLLFRVVSVSGSLSISFVPLSPGWVLILGMPYYISKALKANQGMKQDFDFLNIDGKSLQPGEQCFGMFPLVSHSNGKVLFRYIEESK